MYGIINYETFLLTGILLNITPGNDTIFILSKSMAQGKKAGIMSVLGIASGSVIHTVLAAFGLSIIITKSILVFNIIKYAGALYLLYIGYKMLTDKSSLNTNSLSEGESVNLKKIYRDGVITNVLNPKVALFFIAFLPQFINPASHNTVIPFLTLGITFTCTGLIWSLILANSASLIFAKLKSSKKLTNYVNKTCGAVLIALGLKVAFSSRN
ncbi:resistance to homoserine/threonine (RhtB) family protein [Pseudarcicella hirudinis]|uniref:Resistance to homoserine/threonine (RhtB) family protein n=1 Tax=Pseudarcicella hirudinis TaxID=1079859 RepID=A0A1I5P6Y1_9BACT|nr:LysE family translocator [Pseudarcicella hirudinis]SFP29226.1 resistance to homoserine/threonine (RhtB) family protein [Pseudarcicella hirudinis]